MTSRGSITGRFKNLTLLDYIHPCRAIELFLKKIFECLCQAFFTINEILTSVNKPRECGVLSMKDLHSLDT